MVERPHRESLADVLADIRAELGPAVREPFDREELAHQLRKLRERDGLADEGRLAREAPLLLRLTDRLLELEGAQEQALTPRALRLIEDALYHFSPGSRELLETGLN